MSKETIPPPNQLMVNSPPKLPIRRKLEGQDSLQSTGTTQSSIPSVTGNSRGSVLREDSVVALLTDLYDDWNSLSGSKSEECWKALYEKYHSPNYVLIRPSGNPINVEKFVQLSCSADVMIKGMSLISVDSVQIIADGLVAVATYTVDQKFIYKGTLNEDQCVITGVIEELDGDIKIIHEHRTTGQPIPKQSRWKAI